MIQAMWHGGTGVGELVQGVAIIGPGHQVAGSTTGGEGAFVGGPGDELHLGRVRLGDLG